MNSLRVLQETDLRDLIRIEEANQVFPWTEAAFKRCLEAGYPGWVIQEQDSVIGFILLNISPITSECHILNICIHPDYQGQGRGRALLEFAIDWAKEQAAMMVYLEVRRSNYRAIQLYRETHFKMIGERKNYYPAKEGQEDALVFARDLGIEDQLSREWGIENEG